MFKQSCTVPFKINRFTTRAFQHHSKQPVALLKSCKSEQVGLLENKLNHVSKDYDPTNNTTTGTEAGFKISDA